ncbi:MAG: helicase-related protein [Candidatus Micrarchaeota archaeon]|nr:helicase-related protein [Candidatus Micrarchaeota archaeon]
MDKNNTVADRRASDNYELLITKSSAAQSKYIPRLYQLSIANSVLRKGSTLVVLPTGLGKTLIALLVMKDLLSKSKDVKVLFLAPTKALVEQHKTTISDYFPELEKENEIVALTGTLKKSKRASLWDKRIVISTPQTVVSDLLKNPDSIKFPYSLVVFDEAHRAIGKYSYTRIANIANSKNCLILALTASPGSKPERIQEILNVLGIKNIEIRSYDDPDVSRYVQKKTIKWLAVELDKEYLEAISILKKLGNTMAEQLKNYGIIGNYKSKKGLKELRQKILNMSSNVKYTAITTYTMLFNIIHMQELLETQGVYSLINYYNSLSTRKKTRAVMKLLNNQDIKRAIKLVENKEHPKLNFLLQILKNLSGKKVIVFAQYRVQVEKISEYLNSNSIKAELFLGKGKGFSQKKQKEVIERFRNNAFDVLVSTSIGEEGLDIPSVDVVIFYEPVPSEIRSIQRKGRAGRAKIGEIYILIAKGTRDEYYFWSSFRKEKKMSSLIKNLQKDYSLKNEQSDLHLKEKIEQNTSTNTNSHVPTTNTDITKANDSTMSNELTSIDTEKHKDTYDHHSKKKQTTINDFLH